ncbi:TonB-dependent receptor [Vandammella animalimorsus]|uniref:TonB-dependent receptor n=1 Tax=Vandammella animalimorsus TaxID=2029117 RepID=A0A2A2T3J5_9BURK|nr:TonB-dependent receptor [Vandammella animalimorsus]PAX15761.1 TonB-dependent receptor [Vandammella animalimorsus]PAX19645.1 TonB-dependent receptor [Vandammella animalimorsus]
MSALKSTPLFRLSVLQVALLAGFAHAQQPSDASKKDAELPAVQVQGQAPTAEPVEDWRAQERSTDTDLKEVLADQAAVQFGGGNGVSQWVTIRGMGQDQIDYVVDDASSDAQIFHHQGRFMMDPALVKIIGIEKGTGSASSGIGATSGKIEATTVDALDLLRDGQDVGFRVNGGINTNKGRNGGLSVYGRSGNFDGLFVGNRVDDQNYKDGSGREIGNSALDGRSFMAKAGVNFSDDLRLTLSHRREQESGLRNLREEFFFDTANDDPAHRRRTVDTTTAALRGGQLGFIDTLDLNASMIRSEQKSGAGRRLQASTANIDTNAGNLRLSSRLGAHRIKYGVNLRQQQADSTGSKAAGLGKQEKTDAGLYVEGIWSWHPITLTTGLRYDRFSLKSNEGAKHSDGNVNPSVGLIWDATDTLSFNISHNRASRSPRFYEALLASTPVRYDRDLKAERSQNSEIGFDWVDGGLAVSGSYFQQKIRDLQNFAGMNCVERVCEYRLVRNNGELTNRGYELNSSYRWRDLTARLGVAHSKPKLNGATYDSVATAIPMGRQWTTGLSYHYRPFNLELGWRGRYAQKGSYINATRGSGTPVSRSGYGVHDLHATWMPLGKDTLHVNFAVHNVADKLYRNHSQRSGNNALPEPGREFRLSVNYRY